MKHIFESIIVGVKFVFGVFMIVLIFGSLYISFFHKDLIITFLNWIEIVIQGLGNWNFGVIFLSSLIESFPVIGTFIPGQSILITAGGFFGKDASWEIFGFIMIAAAGGAVIGNYIGYILGVYWGESFFKHYGDLVGIGKTELKYLKSMIHKRGGWFIILGKFHGFTRAFVPFIAGSMGMRQPRFWFFNILGSVIWAVVMVLLGVIFVEYYNHIIQHAGKIMLCIFIGTIIYIYFFKKQEFLTYWEAKNKEIDDKIKEFEKKEKQKKK